MNLLCVGDIHWRATVPRGRTDDYPTTMAGKMGQIFSLADEHNADIILPGDVFDNPTPPMWLLGQIIGQHTAKNGLHRVFVVMGQHDQRYHHTARENTPLGVLEAAGLVRILGAKPLKLGHRDPDLSGIEFYGCSWNGPIPKPADNDRLKILVMHRMVIGSEKLWAQQTDYMWSRQVLRRHKFDLIVTGDNHHFFTDQVPGREGPRYLVNCGSLMRANVDQTKHKPSVVLYDAKERSIEVIRLKVAPASAVMSTEVALRTKERNAELESFVDQIGDTSIDPELNFLSNLDKLARAKGVPKTVADKVDEIVAMSE